MLNIVDAGNHNDFPAYALPLSSNQNGKISPAAPDSTKQFTPSLSMQNQIASFNMSLMMHSSVSCFVDS